MWICVPGTILAPHLLLNDRMSRGLAVHFLNSGVDGKIVADKYQTLVNTCARYLVFLCTVIGRAGHR